MENSTVNKIKSPEPNLVTNKKETKPKRKIKKPNVGVVNVPKISNTPLADTLVMKKIENPHTIYKQTTSKYSFLNLHNVSTIGIFACGGIMTIPHIKKGISFIFKIIKKAFKKK